MLLYAVSARRQRGRLLGGDEGRSLVESADASLAAQLVRNPERMAGMLVPLPR